MWIADKETIDKLTGFARSGGHIIALEETLLQSFDGKAVLPFVPEKDFYSCICGSFNTGRENEKFLSAVKTGIASSRIKISNTGGKIMLREFERPDGQYFAMIQNFSCDTVGNVLISCDFEPVILDIDTLKKDITGR